MESTVGGTVQQKKKKQDFCSMISRVFRSLVCTTELLFCTTGHSQPAGCPRTYGVTGYWGDLSGQAAPMEWSPLQGQKGTFYYCFDPEHLNHLYEKRNLH